MTSDIPEPWASALVAAQLTDPRYSDDRPSLSRLAEVAGLHTTTVSRMVKGSHRASPANVARVADALGKDVVTVSRWVQQARTVREPYQVPAEVNLLTDREQAAISELIRSIAATREEVTGDGEHPAATSQAGESPVRRTRSTFRVPGAAAERSQGESTPQPPRGRTGRSPDE